MPASYLPSRLMCGCNGAAISRCEVTVLEASSSGLRDRAAEIAIPNPSRELLVDRDYFCGNLDGD